MSGSTKKHSGFDKHELEENFSPEEIASLEKFYHDHEELFKVLSNGSISSEQFMQKITPITAKKFKFLVQKKLTVNSIQNIKIEKEHKAVFMTIIKHIKLRARNQADSAKSRQKKKNEIKSLQETVQALKQKREEWQKDAKKETKSLREEVETLKQQIAEKEKSEALLQTKLNRADIALEASNYASQQAQAYSHAAISQRAQLALQMANITLYTIMLHQCMGVPCTETVIFTATQSNVPLPTIEESNTNTALCFKEVCHKADNQCKLAYNALQSRHFSQ